VILRDDVFVNRAKLGENARFLIVNADDFGAGPAVNRAIATSYEKGIVTSASLLVRRPFANQAAAYARSHPELSLGLHVDLGEWFRTESGDWVPRYELHMRDEEAAEHEISLQLEEFERLTGRGPTHLDSHQHIHKREPVKSALTGIAHARAIPLRHHSRARYCGDFYGLDDDASPLPERVTAEALIEIIEALEPGYTELCCHPDGERPAAREVDALTDPRVKAALDRAGIQLCSFHDFARRGAAARRADRRRPTRSPRHGPHVTARPRVVVLGMLTMIPVAGPILEVLQYLIGLERLGCEVYYVEAHRRPPREFMSRPEDDGSPRAAAFLDNLMRRYGFGDRWVYHGGYGDERVFGLTDERLRRLYRDAALIINLNGGTDPLPEHGESGRLVYLETDPVWLELGLAYGDEKSLRLAAGHQAFSTYGLNFGAPDCTVPMPEGIEFHRAPPPVVLDLWSLGGVAQRPVFTTIGNWSYRPSDTFRREAGEWTKASQFLDLVDLPRRAHQEFELALGNLDEDDRRLLERHGWRVRAAREVSADVDAYRRYIASSRGEFTVANERVVEFRTGWFSERSAAYLAAGKPVILQDTGFGAHLPTGAGLFSFSTMEEILAALDAIESDYARQSGAAHEIAREFLAADVVLPGVLEHFGLSVIRPARQRRHEDASSSQRATR
jgi:predicted glycoside hydrolase/deacetylase ChbG (UPF0249 family)